VFTRLLFSATLAIALSACDTSQPDPLSCVSPTVKQQVRDAALAPIRTLFKLEIARQGAQEPQAINNVRQQPAYQAIFNSYELDQITDATPAASSDNGKICTARLHFTGISEDTGFTDDQRAALMDTIAQFNSLIKTKRLDYEVTRNAETGAPIVKLTRGALD
jgi:hypothetical protein